MEINKFHYINITGNIGSGSTTLCKKLAEYFSFEVNYSNAHNDPFLSQFYDSNKFAFQSQMYILLQSLKKNKNLKYDSNIFQDYTIYEHNQVYAKTMLESNLLNDLEYDMLNDVFDMNLQQIHKPELLIYLKVDTKVSYRRIVKRGRNNEKSISIAWLEKLEKKYQEFITEWNICPLITLEYNELDVFDQKEFSKIILTIDKKISESRNF